LEEEDEKDWAPKATQVEDAKAWVQVEEASYAAAQKKLTTQPIRAVGRAAPRGGRVAWLGSVVWACHERQNKGENRTGCKRCQFFTGHPDAHPCGPPGRWDV
jgi:hypothetical protein